MSWKTQRIALFEPWSLGDAIVAASVARVINAEVTLFINSRYRQILEKVLKNYTHIHIAEIDLNYTLKGQGRTFFTEVKKLTPVAETLSDVYSIRGDFRDNLAAKKLFPQARMHVQGYLGFFARRLAPLDRALVSLNKDPINRYALWADILDVNLDAWRELYKMREPKFDRTPRILIHTGAQWRSKAYPDAAALCAQLRRQNYDAFLAYGPGDPVPGAEVPSLLMGNSNSIEELLNCDLAVVNDSAMMHLGALLGCRVLAIGNAGNLSEWLPPHIFHLCAKSMPRGYRPKLQYMSEERLKDWPDLNTVHQKVIALISHTDTRLP